MNARTIFNFLTRRKSKFVTRNVPFSYKGKTFSIKSEGTGFNTKLFIGDEEITNCIYLKLEIRPQNLNELTLVLRDLKGGMK